MQYHNKRRDQSNRWIRGRANQSNCVPRNVLQIVVVYVITRGGGRAREERRHVVKGTEQKLKWGRKGKRMCFVIEVFGR